MFDVIKLKLKLNPLYFYVFTICSPLPSVTAACSICSHLCKGPHPLSLKDAALSTKLLSFISDFIIFNNLQLELYVFLLVRRYLVATKCYLGHVC